MLIASLSSIVIVFCSTAASLHALLTKRDPKSALGWVAFCFLLPVAGPLIYLIFGINRIENKAREMYEKEENSNASHAPTERSTNLGDIYIIGKSITGLDASACQEFQLLENGDELFPRMLEVIDEAQSSVFLSTYIFQNDETGNNLLQALIRAKSRGLDVRIIVDGIGAIFYPPRISKKLARSGLNVQYFDPPRLLPPSLHINLRNHRKLLIVDQSIAFTGGQNISDHHLSNAANNPKMALDIHFSFRGDTALDMSKAFLRDWDSCSNTEQTTQILPPPHSSHQGGAHLTRIILDGPNENLDRLNELLVGTFSLAKKRIWIMTPYFLPGFELIAALIAAKHRGVDVKIILPTKTNISITQWASEHGQKHILARGLKVFLQPHPFIHSKAIVIDDDYSLVGSANLDPRSLRLNFEIGVEVFSSQFNQKLVNYFEKKLDKCNALDENLFSKQTFLVRVRNACAWLFTPYL
ncbi:MAG: phospholipase D-like domain-containing protein [Pseudohongiellaceae bacterium]